MGIIKAAKKDLTLTVWNSNTKASHHNPVKESISGKFVTTCSILVTFSHTMKGNVAFEVPAHYLFDGASIPNIFRPLIGEPGHRKFLTPAAVHDFLYEHGDEYGYPLSSRKVADDIFYELLENEGVSKWKRSLMFLGVRVGGGIFDGHRKAKREGKKVKAALFSLGKTLLGADK